jgi:predicted ATPase
MDAPPGRAAELEQLATCLERAASGRFQAVLVEGEAGIGKTRVLEAALERARERGFRTFAGRSDEIEWARPFGPLSEALGCTPGVDDPRRAEIVSLLTLDQGAGGQIELTRDPGVQFRIVDAFVDLVEQAALSGPVALALEDLHWADPSTVVTLRSLSRRLSYLSVALLATLRPLPRAPGVDGLVDALTRDGAQRIALGPLPEEAVAQLVADLVRAEPGSSLMEEIAGAAGNPLFVGELVKALDGEGAIRVVDGCAELHEVSLPPSLRLTILRRLSFLEEEALELLRVASLLGSTFSLRDAATAPECWKSATLGSDFGTTSSERRFTRTSQKTPAQPSTSRWAAVSLAHGLPRSRLPSSSPSAPSRETPRLLSGCTPRRVRRREELRRSRWSCSSGRYGWWTRTRSASYCSPTSSRRCSGRANRRRPRRGHAMLSRRRLHPTWRGGSGSAWSARSRPRDGPRT